MMKQMQTDDIDFDVYTYSGAITACGKGGQARRALSLLGEMVKNHGETHCTALNETVNESGGWPPCFCSSGWSTLCVRGEVGY